MSRVPLDLYVEVTDHNGTRYKWDANQAPGSRLRNFSFRTKIGDGFADANGQLARRIDLDYPDLNLVNSITVVGADGAVAYEGRLAAMPRELSDSHSIGVTLAGWMAHAKDRKFREVYIDRDRGSWQPASAGRRYALLTANFTPNDGSQITDPTDNEAGIGTGFAGTWASPYRPNAEMWYDAGPDATVAQVAYSWKREGGVNNADAQWEWQVRTAPDDKGTSFDASGNLIAAGPGSGIFTPASASNRWAAIHLRYNTTPAGADGTQYGINWYKLAVYGNHGLTLHTGETGEPDGVYASDVMRDIAGRWCPQLDTSGVQDTSYVIQHLAFKDRTFPYDAFLELNKFHLWHLAVWENRTLHFRPYDLSDYDWEIRTDDPGTTFAPVGPTTDDLFNGIVVTYTDVLTGTVNVLTPDDEDDLRDTSESNPWNQAGIDHWDEIELSTPTVEAQALQIGRAALGDRNRPKTAGTITVRGYIRDRAGIDQPVWKVRAGDVICVTSFNEINRLIVETDYDDETKTLRVAVDFPFQTLEALFDRQQSALTARGLR